jgi:PKD repeat protein
MLFRAFLILACFVIAAPVIHAQKEANIWYFGRGAGIDFNGGVAIPLVNGAIDQKEGCASIADPVTGALLFYTDGRTVWNRDHRAMPNGVGLLGHNDATQSALIVPAPCDQDRFYVFTADASPLMDPPNEGIHYSVVDMDADGGMGDVVQKNVALYAPATEKLTAIRHANGVDYWVITHEWGSNLFQTYQVTAAGVASSPVRSYVGSAHDGSAEYAIGYLKASPDGRMIASIVTTSFAELFDFDARTGLLSNARRIHGRSKYGLSFSPDSRLLYIVERRLGWSYDSLLQYDVTAVGEVAINDSRIAIAGGDYWAMQNAPDGRIYIANNSIYLPRHLGWLATIDRPNERGVACSYNERGFRLEVSAITPTVAEGLPNMIESFADGLITACGPPEAAIGLDDPICAGSCTDIRDSSRNLPTSWQWSFEGGRPSTSTDENPGPVCFDSAGVYRITLVASNVNGSDTVERTLTVRAPSNIRAEAGIVTVAPGDTASVPVTLGSLDPGRPISSITVRLRYDRTMMRPVGIDAGGALLSGWAISVDDDTAASAVIVRATAAPGASLVGPGRLLSFRFATWLATSGSTPLPLELEVPGGICSTVPGRAGALNLELCGLQQRLIELDTSMLLLREARPNPVDRATTIAFTTPRDGHARLAIFEANGTEVALLIDRALPAGSHAIQWNAAAAASGVYYCRLEADGAVATARMVVAR